LCCADDVAVGCADDVGVVVVDGDVMMVPI